MRHYLVIATITAIAFSLTAPSSAKHVYRLADGPLLADSGIQDRYCLQSTGYGYPGNCEYSTFEQCRATASGQDAGCGINPMYGYARQRRGYN
jgi:hypothetical protein